MDDGTVIDESTVEEIAFLSGSRTRFHALRALQEANSLTKGDSNVAFSHGGGFDGGI